MTLFTFTWKMGTWGQKPHEVSADLNDVQTMSSTLFFLEHDRASPPSIQIPKPQRHTGGPDVSRRMCCLPYIQKSNIFAPFAARLSWSLVRTVRYCSTNTITYWSYNAFARSAHTLNSMEVRT